MENRIDLLIKFMDDRAVYPRPEMLNPDDLERLLISCGKFHLKKELDFTDQDRIIISKLANLDKGVLLQGPTGTGKTTILKTFFHALDMMKKVNVKVVSSFKFNSLYRNKGEEVMREYENCHLIIDDLGSEEDTVNQYGTKSDPMATLIMLRYENKAKTWATSNLTKKDLTLRYGDRIMDRFKEMFEFVELTGQSRRK